MCSIKSIGVARVASILLGIHLTFDKLMGDDNRNPVIFRKQHFSTCPRPRFSLLQTFRSEVQDLDRSIKSMAQPAGIWWMTLNSVQYYLYWAIQQDVAAMSYDIKSYVLATAFKQSSSFEISININGFSNSFRPMSGYVLLWNF